MSGLPPPTTAPAGWYADPEGPGTRYFDGHEWAARGPAFRDREDHPDLPLVVAVVALAILVVSLLASKLVLDAVVDRGWPLPVYVALVGAIGYGPSVAWGVHVRRRWGAGRFASVGWRFRWSDLGWGPLAWLGAIAAQIVLGALVLVLDVPLTSNVDGTIEAGSDRAYVIATLITAVIAAPVVEELVFRGLVLRGLLSRMGPVLAVGLQGVLFGLAHVDPVRGWGNAGLVAVLSGVGIAFGVAAYLLRRLGPTVIAHAIFNGLVLVLVLTGAVDSARRELDADRGASTAVEQLVVDQAHLTEPRRREDHRRTLDEVDVAECRRVDELHVLQ